MKYWIEMFFAFVISGVAFGYKEINKRMQENDCKQAAIEKGIEALLRDRLIQLCSDTIKKKSCSVDTLDDIKALYEQYHILGGNGTVTGLFDRVKKLPIEQKEG